MLTSERLRQLLHYEAATGLFTWKVRRGGRANAGSVAGAPNSYGHIGIGVDGKIYLAHHLAWLYMTGGFPEYQVDHKNTIRSDNRWDNLRQATNAQNKQNMRKARSDNKSGLLGVGAWRGVWRARIMLCGKSKWIGTFPTPELAHAAYLEEKKRLHPFQTLVQHQENAA